MAYQLRPYYDYVLGTTHARGQKQGVSFESQPWRPSAMGEASFHDEDTMRDANPNWWTLVQGKGSVEIMLGPAGLYGCLCHRKAAIARSPVNQTDKENEFPARGECSCGQVRL